VSGVPQGSVLGPLLFILYTADLFDLVENDLFTYADDATLVAVARSPVDRLYVADSINRDLFAIDSWCVAWDMKLNASKSKTFVAGRSRTVLPYHPALTVGDAVLDESDSLMVLGVTFDPKLTFERHVRNIVSMASQKLGIIRKANRIFGDAAVTSGCFRSFVLPLLEYCSPVWSSAAESHLRLLERVVRCAMFVSPGCDLGDLTHRRTVGSLSMLYKIANNQRHPLHEHLPPPYVPTRVTRGSLAMHEYAFAPIRYRTYQYSRCFMLKVVRIWNSLNSLVFAADCPQGFKSRANRFLLTGSLAV